MNSWQFLLCSECHSRVALAQMSRPFVDSVLCPDCVQDLFENSEIVPQEPFHSQP